jgi:hypothetical protein
MLAVSATLSLMLAATPVDPWSLERVVAEAMERAPEVAAARAEESAAEGVLPQAAAEEVSAGLEAAARKERMKERTPRVDFRRVAQEDVRLGGLATIDKRLVRFVPLCVQTSGLAMAAS